MVALVVFGGLLLLCFAFGFALLHTEEERSPYGGGGPRVGVVEVRGPIADAKDVLESMEKFRRDPEIRAIVLRVDSPGGAVGPSQEIFRAVERTKKDKKVVASLGALAASGGYYAASAADRIVASPGTITGSIGVIAEFAEVSELLDLAKIRTATFKSGPLKDSGSPTRPLTDADRAHFDALVREIYGQFVRDVARSRGIAEEKLRPMADGRVLTGEQAHREKLVDELGNLNDALALAAALAGATGDPVPVYPEKHDLSALLGLLEGAARSLGDAGAALRSLAPPAPGVTIQAREPLVR